MFFAQTVCLLQLQQRTLLRLRLTQIILNNPPVLFIFSANQNSVSNSYSVKKLVIMASGSGSNFQAIINSIENNEIDAEIAGLIVNKEKAGAIKRAELHSIPYRIIHTSDYQAFSKMLGNQLKEWNPDLIVLAGFLKKIPDHIVREYAGQIINIHPSLLPKYGGKGFYGEHVHQAVLKAGDSHSGCTVHFVNEHYDEGDIIAQKKVEVLPNDTPETLAKRVLKEEHLLLPAVIRQLLNQN